MRARHAVVVTLLLAGCVEPYLLTDGTSVSVGRDNGGILRNGRQLPLSGDGFLMGRVWSGRHANYGTDELVSAIERNSALVAAEFPGSVAGIADMAHRGGGGTSEHHSHQSGRDVDILFYGDDADGNVLPPPAAMVPYRGADSWSEPATGVDGFIPPRQFDTARNWAMIRAWLTDPDIDVQWIFVFSPLRERLLDYAASIGEPRDIQERADAILHQPSDSMPHDDHMHIRIFCSPSDRYQGCIDIGPYRWDKKLDKYDGRYRHRAPPQSPDIALAGLAATPLAELALLPR